MTDSPRDEAVGDLLMASYPLMRLLRGEKRAFMQRAWINAANGHTMNILHIADDRLPRNPRAAAEALLRSSIQLAQAQGITGPELTEFFNHHQESGEFGRPENIDNAIERCVALLACLRAARMTRDTNTEERKSA